jgi:hypothetical protein
VHAIGVRPQAMSVSVADGTRLTTRGLGTHPSSRAVWWGTVTRVGASVGWRSTIRMS